jgi:hypothetical protein
MVAISVVTIATSRGYTARFNSNVASRLEQEDDDFFLDVAK